MKTLIFIMTAAGLLYACGTSQREQKPKQYAIAYNVHNHDTTRDDWEIMRMKFDGSEKKNITNNPDVAWTYLAYKDRLFISDRDTCYRCFFLYECDANGNNIRKISNLQLEDSWMSARDGGEEIIVGGRLGDSVRNQLFIIKRGDGSFRQLTKDTAAIFRDPCFSPDGKKK